MSDNVYRRLRQKMGYTQRQLADELGLSSRVPVHRWETGRSHPSRMVWLNLLRLAQKRLDWKASLLESVNHGLDTGDSQKLQAPVQR